MSARRGETFVFRFAVHMIAAVAAPLSLSLVALPRAAAAADGSSMRIAFGSCNMQDKGQGYWRTIAERRPDMWIWGGDIVYADRMRPFRPPPLEASAGNASHVYGSTYSCLVGSLVCFAGATPERLRALYAKQKGAPEYRDFVASVPKLLGIWDDHDMGLNDGDSRYRWMEESKQVLLDFLDEPADSVRRSQRGVWGSYMAPGAKGRRVAVHLLDVRHNRDPYGTAGGDFLGEEQWSWLDESLRAARDEAAVNIVVSGLQVLRPWPFGGEVWDRFPDARRRLLRTLAGSGAKGLVLLSGDVHMAQLNAVRCGDTVIHELTSSGLTHSVRDYGHLAWMLASMVLWVFPQHHLIGSTWFGRNFGELDISVGPDGSASVVGRIVSLHPGSSEGEPVIERSFDALSRAGVSTECSPFHGAERPTAIVMRAVVASGSLGACALLGLLAVRACWRRRQKAQKLHEM